MSDRIAGRVVTPADDDFERVAFERQWNRLHPERTPDAIVRRD